MGSQSIALWAGKESSLQGVINDVMNRTSMQAATKHNIISNDVEADIRILTDSARVRSLLKRILELILTVSKDSHIHISAKTYTDLVLVHFKEDNIQNLGFVFNELKTLVPEAEQLGGFLGITSHENKLTTIAFTFLNAQNSPRLYMDRLAQTIAQTGQRPRDKH